MSRDTIHIRSIDIHRALGIRQGDGFRLSDLASGINLVFGPNGSGKSTTCLVMQELLWPGTLERPTVEGVISAADDEWLIEVDAGYARYFRNGQAGALPDFGSKENRARYLLGLKELIIGDNEDFARKIAEASQGGYDIEKASGVLGFRAKPRSRKSESDKLQEEAGKVEEVRRKQIQIEREWNRLPDLQQRLDEAIKAGHELNLLCKAREYQQAVHRCSEVRIQLDAIPDAVARLRGDERTALDALRDEAKSLTEQRVVEEERLRQAKRDIEEIGLPGGGISDDLLRDIRALKRSLRDVEMQIRDAQRRRDEAAGQAEEALRQLGNYFTAEQLALIGSVENSELGEFARKVHRLRAREHVLNERRNWLGAEEPENTRGLHEDELRDGIAALTRWLASPSESSRTWGPSWRSIVALVLLAAAGGLAFATVWLWAAAVLVAAILFVLEWVSSVRQSTVDGANSRDVVRTTYMGLSLPMPDAWDKETVRSLLRDLIGLKGAKALYAERQARMGQLVTDEAELENSHGQLKDERRRFEARLGLALVIEDEWLPILVDRIRSWQRSTSQVAALEAALIEPERQRDDLVRQINELLTAIGCEPIRSSDEAEELIADVEERRSRHGKAVEALERASERIHRSIEPGLEIISSKQTDIFRRLGIDEDREAELDDWLGQYAKYRELTEALAREEAICSDRTAALADRPDLQSLDAAALELRMETCKANVDERNDLSETIGRIKNQIQEAKAGHALSDALERRDEALEALAAARDENGRAVAGSVLVDWVRQEAVERSRPQVFQRANELFVRFTRGTLRLEMDDSEGSPAFVARRGTFPRQSLSELSGGERIQLMIAVRLAFLEQDETRRLPLLVDEVLGTSDDGRSGILIDTLIEIARQGRQVFYCTAQHDEVGKWKARLMETEVPYKVLDLGEIRGGAAQRTEPMEIAAFETADPLSPYGLSYWEYGSELGVRDLDPRAETIDAIHLWHVLDDADMLYNLLSKGIVTWGQLEMLMAHNGAGFVDTTDGAFDRAQAVAKAIWAACEAWRIGRGKPVDRNVLLDAGCVSDIFIDDVSALARRLGGDAEAIVRALEGKAVGNWLKKNTERLRDYFEEEGYLSYQRPLDRHELRVRVMTAVSEELRSGVIEHELVDQLIYRLVEENEAVGEAA